MIRVLDCTLRDGGRIINCEFEDSYIREMSYKLAAAKIDIVEIGFLRDWRNVNYQGNSTFFTDVEQIVPFVDKTSNSMYVAFVDFGMFDFDSLRPFDGRSIDGIRVGFTKKNFLNEKDEIVRSLHIVKDRGYKLFIQGVNSLAYSDKEMLEVIEMVNEIEPFSFGIVDTYGAMYQDDVSSIFNLINHNLLKGICIDFHSHNNYQLSFSLAQEMISLSYGKRDIIIDSTLNGMGKVAGNLNTELLVDYLVRKCGMDYEFNLICDLIDDYIYPYKKGYEWGYSIPALMAGIYQSHPNNVIYLTSKFRLQSRDIKNLISMIDPELRQRYDYDNIEKLYVEYTATKIDDMETIQSLKKMFGDKKILVIVPGSSIIDNKEKIDLYARKEDVFTISVNFADPRAAIVFYGNKKRYFNLTSARLNKPSIVTSNIAPDNENDYVVNYYDLIDTQYKYFENSTMMLLYLLRRIGVENICLAGFDGFKTELKTNYINNSFQNDRHIEEFDEINREIQKMMEEYIHSIKYKCNISFLTDSLYCKTGQEVKCLQ